MNPEYRIAKKFCKKAAESRALVVALLPARTDTAWFHNYVQGRAEIRFLRGRIKFLIDDKPILNPKSGKPAGGKFPSMIAIWRNLPDGAP